ncbi:MAG: RNA polymerase subunit sigma-24, partial [Actinomycetota bacterium]|nr:RNA polymerase subunit sigma-24 [Actinomycetota bacterium]
MSTEVSDPAEAALVARLAGGEREAPMAELYERYGRRVYALGRRLLGDETQAEELVQETFVRLWQSAGRYDAGRATVRAWVW